MEYNEQSLNVFIKTVYQHRMLAWCWGNCWT